VTAQYEDFDELVTRVRELPEPAKKQREAQTLCFAYGNLACSTNHKPSRAAFKQLALERYGWTKEEFDVWADQRRWEVP
jgi:hypothetical protein